MPSKRNKNDDEASVISERFVPEKNVASLMGEGEKFCRDQLFSKAIQCYTEALELEEGNKNALVERAACYLKLGKNQLALVDAEESLKEDKVFTKGLYEKAEALYAMGEFELALVFYHRGKKLRGDVKEFQLGINKAQEAIDNCVGDPHSVKLEVKGDLSYFNKPDEQKKKTFKLNAVPKYGKQPSVVKREKRSQKPGTQKTVKQLLGELYADKVYLEKLLNDDNITRQNTTAGDAIWGLANNGLDFLDSRTEFWRQQKPIYARKNSYANGGDSNANNPLNLVLKRLETIDTLQTNGKFKESLDKSNKLLSYVKPLNIKQLNGKEEIIANIHSNIGNAHLELGQYDLALQAHQKDLDMSKDLDNAEGISRAYENIGRVYARNGKYSEAIEVWEKKLPLAETDMEKAWLYHEIGRCQLELGEYDISKDYGKKSLECAENIDDEVWQLNATVLIAQSDVKIGTSSSLNSAVENFEKALKMTEKQNDHTAGNAIVKALADCKQKIEKLSMSENDEEKLDESEAIKSPVEKEEKKEEPPKESAFKNAANKVTIVNRFVNDIKKALLKVENIEDTADNTIPDAAKPEPDQKVRTPSPEPVEKTKTPSPEPIKSPEPAQSLTQNAQQEDDGECNYRIEVKTTDEPGSGTDANVYICLIGEKEHLNDQLLKTSTTNQDPYEQGKLDVFWIKTKLNTGKLKSVKISNDGKGFGSGFLFDYIQVNFEDITYKFSNDGDEGSPKWLEEETMELNLTEERPDNSDYYMNNK